MNKRQINFRSLTKKYYKPMLETKECSLLKVLWRNIDTLFDIANYVLIKETGI